MTNPFTIIEGNCLEKMKSIDADSIDSIVTDPPYGLEFMGKEWDHGVPAEDFWIEALRVAKLGAHLLAFGGTRTYHRLGVAIEDAGWEIRDCIMWVYGSGFPKSHDVSKGIDKHGSSTHAAAKWQGWGTALKPSWEPIIVARKPLVGTVAENVLKHGTGGINIDGCRIKTSDEDAAAMKRVNSPNSARMRIDRRRKGDGHFSPLSGIGEMDTTKGRFPANLIHDGSDEVMELFPQADSARVGNPNNPHRGVNHDSTSFGKGDGTVTHDYRDSGSAARFFYCAKTSRRDREEGLECLEQTSQQSVAFGHRNHGTLPYSKEIREQKPIPRANNHPTVKPTDLMRYLCRLVTPPNGIVLDPFMGSGSTGKAAMLEGFRFTGIELNREYVEIATARIQAALDAEPSQPTLGELFE